MAWWRSLNSDFECSCVVLICEAAIELLVNDEIIQ